MVTKAFGKLSGSLRALSALSLTAMIVLTVLDVGGRAIGTPVEGAIEVTGFLATLVLAFAMPDSHISRVHIGVDILTRKLSPKIVAVMDVVTGIAATALFGFIARQSFLYAITLRDSGERSMTLQMPLHVFVYAVSLSFGVLAIVQALDVFANMKKAVR